MCATTHHKLKARITSPGKSRGLTYTPEVLARFMSERLIARLELGFKARGDSPPEVWRVLDPAVGDGVLLHAIACALKARWPEVGLALTGVDIDADALAQARDRCAPVAPLHAVCGDFLRHYDAQVSDADLIIANPPYVRAQSLDGRRMRRLAKLFGLKGHKDLSHAFMLAILDVVRRNPGAMAATVIPNSVLLTAAAAPVREQMLAHAALHEIWDLGDTRLFDAAVLPMILLFSHDEAPEATSFLSAYTHKSPAQPPAPTSALDGLRSMLSDEAPPRAWASAPGEKRIFELRRGVLAVSAPHGNWVLRDAQQQALIDAVNERVWKRMSEIGRIKVGVKSCADAVFLRREWESTDVESELLLPLMTHHVARPFRSTPITRELLYPHVAHEGGRALVDLDDYPGTKRYLESHRKLLSRRKYLANVGREWFELWVPHDPARWSRDKVVWRDIATRPTFWLDQDGSVVNGDCYWLDLDDEQDPELLWLVLALGNSDFAHHFYQATSGHQIYAGRRRYMSRYLKHFPLPEPGSERAVELITLARTLHDEPDAFDVERDRLNALVWGLWGLDYEEFESP